MDRTRISINNYTLFKDEITFLSDKMTTTKERILWENNSQKFRWILMMAIESHVRNELYKVERKVWKDFVIIRDIENESTDSCITLLKKLKVSNLQSKKYSNSKIEDYLSEIEDLLDEQKAVKNIKPNDKLEDKEIKLLFQYLQELKTIDLRDTAIENLEILIYLEKVEVLSISENPIMTLDGIENLKKLRKLFCINTEIETVENLKNCKNLQEIYCAKNQIKSLESLSDNESLVLINCRKTLITKEEIGIFLKSKPNCKVIRKGFLF